MLFEQTGFDVNYWSRLTLEEFVSECKASGVMAHYGDRQDDQLGLIYNTIIYDAGRTESKAGGV